MSTHSSTQALPGIGSSPAPRTNLRAYLAGTGATTALIAGLVILFLAAGAYVAFSGNPFGGDDASDSVTIGNQAGAPEAAALALAAGPDAVAPAPTALVGGPGAAVDGGAAFAAGVPGSAPPGTTLPGTGTGTGPGGEPIPTPTSGGGALGDTVGIVDDTAGNLGLDLDLGQTTGPITDNLDRTVTDTLNNVGGNNGGGGLGDRVNDTVGGVRDGVNRGLGGLGLGGN
jgi:hypothetical protein